MVVPEALFDVLDRLEADLDDGALRTLLEYRALFPQHQGLVEHEYALCVAGRRLGGYTLLREIGRGGQAVVYFALGDQSPRPVAVKRILRSCDADRERLAREFHALRLVQHPSVCRVFESIEVEGSLAVAMEYLPGGTLADWIALRRADQRPLDAAEIDTCLGWLADIAEGIAAAHRAGFVHRDLKPSNVMFDSSERAVITDFGIALLLEQHTRITAPGFVVGTPAYASPEQWSGGRVGPESDVWSLCVIAFELLVGRPPFSAAIPREFRRAVCRRRHDDPLTLAPDLPIGLRVILGTGLAKEPERRYHDARLLAQDFRALRTDARLHARPARLPTRLRYWIVREKVRAGLGALATLAVVLALALAWFAPEIRAGRALHVEAMRDAFVAEGFRKLGDTDFLSACADFERALAIDGQCGEAAAGYALGATYGGRAMQALEFLEARPELEASEPTFAVVRAEALRKLDRDDEAERLAARWARERPTTELGWLLAATLAGRDPSPAAQQASLAAWRCALLRAPEKRALYYMQCAHRAWKCGDRETAQVCAEELIAQWPRSHLARLYAGNALALVDKTKAMAELGTAIELDPKFAGAYLARAVLGIGLSESAAADERRRLHATARADLDAAIACDGQDFVAWHNRAVLRGRTGDLSGAVADYGAALALRPDHVHSRRGRTEALQHLGRWRDSLADLEQCALELPADAEVRYWSGRALARLATRAGSPRERRAGLEAAAAGFRACLGLDPAHVAARGLLAGVLLELGSFGEARCEFELALQQEPRDAHLWHNLAMVLEEAASDADAIAAYDHALECDPRSAQTLYQRGLVHGRAGDLAAAQRDFRAALELRPKEPFFRLAAARAAHAANLEHEVVALLADADVPIALRAELFGLRGAAKMHLAAQGRCDPTDALNDLCLALQLAPGDPNHRFHRGQVFGLLHQSEAAVLDLAEALAARPNDGMYHLVFGEQLRCAGDELAARAAWRHALGLDLDPAVREDIIARLDALRR